MHTKPDRRHEDLGDVVRGRARSDAAEFYDGLGSHPLVHTRDAGFFRNANDIIVLSRDTDVFKFCRVELDAGFAEELL